MITKTIKDKPIIRKKESSWKNRGIMEYGNNGKLIPLTYETYMEILKMQNGRCAICGRNDFWGELQVDHDHKTGLFRGLLCYQCNRYAVGTYERTGKYKNIKRESILKEYINNPPYSIYIKKIKKRKEKGMI
ncbi:MAG: endonuclease domain-containing protein [Thermoplasmatales archaeon]